MKENYEEALRRCLKHEGGYGNHPDDPGGPTNFGITLNDYRRFINKAATAIDVKNMTVEQAKKIYRAQYWDAQRCDELPHGVDYAMFDYGVNSGIGRSGKVLRRILSLDDKSSVVTPGVVSAAKAKDPAQLVEKICDERLAFLKRLKTWNVFGAGWGRRVLEVRQAALAMIRKSSVQVPREPEKPAPGKANDIKQPWYKKLWAKLAGGGLLGTGVTVGGITLDAPTIYALCALIVICLIGLWAFLRFIKPRLR